MSASKPTDGETIATLTANSASLESSLKQVGAEVREASNRADKAALILQGIVRAIASADQEAGNVQATSDWRTLLEAAANHAFYILTDCNLGAEQQVVA